MNPVLKWVGGKRKLLPELLARLPADVAHRRHVEPFAGGAALFFAREPQRARLSDANAHLIAFYRALREAPETLIEEATELANAYAADPKEEFYAVRRLWNKRLYGSANGPAMFLFLNKTCFNGLWRENKKGEFNVPMGRYKNPTIVDADAIRRAARLLQGIVLNDADFDTLGYDEEDFVYFDPPYVPLSPTSAFTSYAAGGFGKKDQERLAALFRKLSGFRIPCMLSNSDTPLVRELYEGFVIETVQAGRSINSDGAKRGAVAEVIVRNGACCG